MKSRLPVPHRDNEKTLVSALQNIRDVVDNKVAAIGEKYDSEYFQNAWETFRTRLSEVGDRLEDKRSEVFAAATVFLQQNDLLHWTKQLTDGVANASDKAMDAVYLKTHVGGGEHRLFDGGHTIVGSWEVVKNAHGGDAQFSDWLNAYMKDLTTPMGMPFVTLEKADYARWVDNFAGRIPGVDRQYLYDLLTFDAMEIITTGFTLAAVWFAFNKEDKQKLAQILGAMGISSITAANPIMGLATIIVTAYAYWKHGGVDVAGLIKGGGLTAFSAFMFSIMGLPVLVELAVVISLSIILGKYIFESHEFADWLRSKLQDALTASTDHFNSEWFLSVYQTAKVKF